MKILLTGFEPFGGETVNPSWQAALKTAEKIDFAEVLTVCLPVEYYKSVEIAIKAVDDFCPDAVLLTGQAGGRTCVSFENIAVNIADSDTPDNAGKALHTVNFTGGPDRLFSSLPLKEMVDAVNKIGLPAYISQNAGRFVCNHVFYGVLKHISDNNLNIKAGFAHVPFIPAQTVNKPERPSMSLENITECMFAALAVLR